MTVRPITPNDRDAWLSMRAALWPEASKPELKDDIDAFLNGSESITAVFVNEETPGEITGFLELSLRNYAEGCSGVTPYVEGWYVSPEHRRRGVGRALMDATAAWARAHGFVELASDTEIDNVLSQNAHRKSGFEEVERIVIFRRAL